jgi:hypothetical protein
LTLANGHMAHAHLVSAVLSTLSAIAILSTIACSHRLRGLTWADVVENCFALRPPYIDPPTLPGRSTSAVLVVDARRLARSARLRLKPLSNLFPLLVVVLLGPVIWRLTNGPIALPSALRPNRGEFAAGGAAMFAYTATIATASVFAMDADRHALTLWQTIPGGVRTVARARAIASSAVSVTVGVLGAVVLAYSFGLTAKEFVWCLLAAGAVAVVGTVLDLTASLRWPQLDWVEATEIGTSNGPRWVLRMTSGIPIVGAVAVVRLLPAPLGQLESIIFALLILAAVPLLAGCITAAIAPFSLRNANA